MPLLERAQLLGADALATGHYARIEGQPGDLRLLRGVDSNKDQSYFLYRLRQDQLSRLMFPLGGMNKAEVREHARRFGMPLADKHESQEICFVGKEGYAATVEKILGHGGKAGRFVDDQRKFSETTVGFTILPLDSGAALGFQHRSLFTFWTSMGKPVM